MEENTNQANAAEELKKAMEEATPEERKKAIEELRENIKSR